MRSQGLLGRQTAFCPRHWLAPTANSLTRSDRRKKGDDRCKAGDVVLYKRPPDSYVLHRVVEVRENDYVILGDNCAAKEYGIKDADILGVMTGYVRGGCSPLAAKKAYPVFLDASAQDLETLFISAGQRGVALELAPQDLAHAAQASFALLTRPA